ncbi:negative mitosis regulator [Histoplasma capsulatum var. duboisii H88]|uniref:Negative mitosis regulator n=1 Tax=Ajellomyces capsulatus (strain H88) TaxID=544711 RepID=A0A8A1LJR8_AJEC8|nr:negative mitosis regulator [Histoplasma capsulatum var. duboisii H88]
MVTFMLSLYHSKSMPFGLHHGACFFKERLQGSERSCCQRLRRTPSFLRKTNIRIHSPFQEGAVLDPLLHYLSLSRRSGFRK